MNLIHKIINKRSNKLQINSESDKMIEENGIRHKYMILIIFTLIIPYVSGLILFFLINVSMQINNGSSNSGCFLIDPSSGYNRYTTWKGG